MKASKGELGLALQIVVVDQVGVDARQPLLVAELLGHRLRFLDGADAMRIYGIFVIFVKLHQPAYGGKYGKNFAEDLHLMHRGQCLRDPSRTASPESRP